MTPKGSGITRRGLMTALPLTLAAGIALSKRTDAANGDLKRASAEGFLDSVGVCTHFGMNHSVYTRSFESILPELLDLGVRHLRDSGFVTAQSGRDSPAFIRFRRCVAEGMRFSLICYDPLNPYTVTPADRLGDIFDWCDGGIVQFEGGNEPVLINDPDKAPAISYEHQRQLHEAIHTTGRLSHLPLAGPSYIQRNVPLARDLSSICDYGNIHPYAGMEHPETTGPGSLERIRDASAHIFGDLPTMVTEIGYHTSLRNPGFHFPVSEAIKTRYLPRSLLWAFAHDIRRTYIYEFVSSFDRGDTDPESSFGLLRHDLGRTPAYEAIRALLSLCAASGGHGRGGPLRGIAFADEDTDRVGLLLDRSDGALLVPVWLGIRGWRWPGGVEAAPQERNTTFSVAGPHNRVRAHRFRDDGSVEVNVLEADDGAYPLSISDQVTVLEIA